MYGITVRRCNPVKILDELIKAFDVMFIDDDYMEILAYEPKEYEDVDLYLTTMVKCGYLAKKGGGIVIPEREERDFLPYDKRDEDELKF